MGLVNIESVHLTAAIPKARRKTVLKVINSKSFKWFILCRGQMAEDDVKISVGQPEKRQLVSQLVGPKEGLQFNNHRDLRSGCSGNDGVDLSEICGQSRALKLPS